MTRATLRLSAVAVWLGAVLAGVPGGLHAQSSASFQIEQPTLNAGGHPADGVVMSSASHTISVDSMGEGVAAVSMTSASFLMDAGRVTAYQPPGEVAASCGVNGAPCLTLTHSGIQATLSWPVDPSAGSYNLYRDLTSNLSSLGFGACYLPGLGVEQAMDADPVPAQQGFFYLVTSVNRLGEQGTKGFRSNGAERLGTICP